MDSSQIEDFGNMKRRLIFMDSAGNPCECTDLLGSETYGNFILHTYRKNLIASGKDDGLAYVCTCPAEELVSEPSDSKEMAMACMLSDLHKEICKGEHIVERFTTLKKELEETLRNE